MPRSQTTDSFSRRARLSTRRKGWGPHGGFTLIEVLIAVSVIFVLMGIVFVALKHSQASAKTQQTVVTLGQVQSLYAELETTGATKTQPGGWFWWQGGAIDGSNDGFIESGNGTVVSAGMNFWTKPFVANSQPDAMSVPGAMGEDPLDKSTLGGNLVGSPAVLNTQLAMSVLLAVSNNRQAFDKLPQDMKMTLPYVAGQQFTAPDASAFGWTGYMNSGTPTAIAYGQGNRVTLNNTIYRALAAGVTTTAPPGAGWASDTRNAPLLKDGWGHPIIYVGPGGLRVRLLNGQKTFNPSDKSQNFIIIAPPGRTGIDPASPNLPVVVSPGRPFFASAGPDGDFSAGDDNIYSFESK